VSGDSPAVGGKGKGAPGVPTAGEGGRCGAGRRRWTERWRVGARCDAVRGTGRRSFGWHEVWRGAAVLGAPFIGWGRREVSGRGRSPVGVEWSQLMATVLRRGGNEAVDL
jgi:hypothetical protein